MLLPNHAEATIAVGKTRDYLLDVDHNEGASKARLLIRIGFRRDAWSELEVAIRRLIAENDAIPVLGEEKEKYPVEGILYGPNGSRRFRTVWVMDGDTPFLATAYPTRR